MTTDEHGLVLSCNESGTARGSIIGLGSRALRWQKHTYFFDRWNTSVMIEDLSREPMKVGLLCQIMNEGISSAQR